MTKFRKLIASLSVVAILSTLVVSSAVSASTFNDVPADAYFAEAVEALVESGCVDTTGKTSFFPNNSTTRAEVAKLLVCATGKLLPEAQWPATASFPDVQKGNWAYPFVESAKAAGIVNGYANGNFGPNDLITREQFAKMVVEAFDLPMMTYDLSTFADSASLTQPWAPGYMQTAVHFGVVTGSKGADGKTYLNPTQAATRGQAVTMINRATDADSSEEEGEDDEDSEDDEDDEEVTYEGGSLEVELSDNSPDGDVVPGSVANAHVATFTLTAGDEDVRVTSLEFKRTGLGSDDAFDDIAVVSEDGERLSKAKSFNSDDLAVVNMLNGGFVIEAGESVDLKVLGTVGDADDADIKGDSFGVALMDAEAVQSSAEEVEGDFPVASETFEVGGANAGTLTFDQDGTSPDVNVGERDVEIAAFDVEGDSENDVELYALRLEQTDSINEDTDLANFRLYIEGEEVAMAEEAVGGFINFTLDEPFLFEDSKSYELRVHADILGGAGEEIVLGFDSALDVEAVDTDYGFGAGVVAEDGDDVGTLADDITTLSSPETLVKAGAVTVVAVDPDYDSIDDDKDNVVLGTLKITANSGDNLELQELEFTFTNGAALADEDGLDGFSRVFENVELVSKSGTYDLDEAAGATTTVSLFGNDDLDILIKEGETLELTLRADTKEDDGWLEDLDLTISLADIGGASLYLEETGDDEPVEDITPSSLSFNSLEGSTTSATATVLVQSATKTAVVGSQGIEALAFEIEAGDASDLKVREVTVGKSAGDATFDSDTISKVSLYVDSVKPENLLASKSGSQISTTLRLDFASKAVTVEADDSRNFYVTVDVVDDEGLEEDTLKLSVTALDIKDIDNDDVDATGLPLASTRTLTIAAAGTLTASVDTSDTAVNKAKFAVAGSTSDFIASYELTALNEPMRIDDFTITQTDAQIDLEDYVSELIIYKEDKTTVLARKAVTSDTVEFTGVNYMVELGSENIYVKAVTHRYGKDLPGAVYAPADDINLTFDVDKFRGGESGKSFADGASTVTGASLGFMVVPVQISDASFVSTYSGELLNTELTNGENTVSIVKLDNATHSNTDTTDGGALETLVKKVVLTQSKFADTVVSGYTMERINGTEDEVDAYNVYDGQVLTLTPAVDDTTVYSFYVDGTLVTYTSDADATAAEIVAGLKADLEDSVALTEGGTTTLTLTAADDDGAFITRFSDTLTPSGADGLNKIVFDLSGLTSDNELEKGQSGYFVVKADVTKDDSADTQDFLRLSFSAFNTGEVTFSSDEEEATDIAQLRLQKTSLTGTQISARD